MVRRQNGFRRGAAGLAGAVVFSMTGGAVLATGSAVETSSARLGSGPAPAPTAAQTPAPVTQTASVAPRAVLDRYCVTCHNDRLRTGGLTLDAASVDAADPSRHADVWEKVIAKLRTGAMPPPGRPRPDAATYDAVAGRLESDIDRAAAANPDPGRTSTVHRLNRTEYRNAIRDLLALDLDVTPLLPGDETSDTGFDNNADVLSISTAQLERYLSAARTITRLATGLTPTGPGFETFDVPLLLLQDERQSEQMPLGSRGGVAVPYHFPVDGDYLVKIELRSNWQDYILGMGSAHLLDVRIDGELVERLTVGGEAPGPARPGDVHHRRAGRPGVGGVPADGRRAARGARAGGGRSAHGERVVRAQRVGAGGHPEAAAGGRGAVERRGVQRLRRGQRGRHRRAVRGDRGRRHAEPAAHLLVPARDRGARGRASLRHRHRLAAGAARLPPAGDAGGRGHAARLLRPRPGGRRQLRRRHPARAGADAGRSRFPPAHRTRPRGCRPRRAVPPERRGGRLAPVVLPLGQHPGRAAARRGRAGQR